jgi:hypothetical protein
MGAFAFNTYHRDLLSNLSFAEFSLEKKLSFAEESSHIRLLTKNIIAGMHKHV